MKNFKKLIKTGLIGMGVLIITSSISSNSLHANAKENPNLDRTYKLSYENKKTQTIKFKTVDFTKYMSTKASKKAFANYDENIGKTIKNQVDLDQRKTYSDRFESWDDFDLKNQKQKFTSTVKANSKNYLSVENKSEYISNITGKISASVSSYYTFNKKTGELYKPNEAYKIVPDFNKSKTKDYKIIKNEFFKKYAHKKYTYGELPLDYYKNVLEANAFTTKKTYNWFVNKQGKISFDTYVAKYVKGTYKKKKDKDGGVSENASFTSKIIELVIPNKVK